MSRTFNLFISHSWSYDNQYNNLVRLLRTRSYFSYNDYSIPKSDPVHTSSDSVLYNAIKAKISLSSVVLIVAGVYSTHSKWINKEIEIAQSQFSNSKPILAIKPFANTNISSTVRSAATRIVNWNTDSIVEAIREIAV